MCKYMKHLFQNDAVYISILIHSEVRPQNQKNGKPCGSNL